MPGIKHTSWLFTLFNYTEESINKIYDDADEVEYLVGQEECCPRTNRRHFQGYVIIRPRVTMRGAKVPFGSLCPHLEGRRGTHEQAVAYCQKLESRYDGGLSIELGCSSGESPGSRTDCARLLDRIMAKTPIREICIELPNLAVRNYANIRKLQLQFLPVRCKSPTVYVFYGESGCGKSAAALELYESTGFWLSDQWWDGYEGQPKVVIDEFSGWLPFEYLKKLLDRYPLQVNCKGYRVNFVSDVVIFTSNIRPYLWYKQVYEGGNVNFQAFDRRLDYIYKCTETCFERVDIFENKKTI